MKLLLPLWVRRVLAVFSKLTERLSSLTWFSNDVPVVLAKSDGRLMLSYSGRSKPIALGRAKGKRYWAIELPEDLALVQALHIPLSDPVERAAAASLAAEMASPFRRDDCAWGYDPAGGHLVMASRDQIQAHAKALSQIHGLEPLGNPSQCEVWYVPTAGAPVVLAGFAERVRSARVRLHRWVANTFLALSVLLALAIWFSPLAQLVLRVESAEAQIRAAKSGSQPAQATRERLLAVQEKLSAVSQVANQSQLPTESLARVTAVVPDDTWLQRLQWQSGKVTLQGQTPNTATFMAALSKEPDIKDVKAPTAATKSTGSGKENFVVEFSLLPPSDGVKVTGADVPAEKGAP